MNTRSNLIAHFRWAALLACFLPTLMYAQSNAAQASKTQQSAAPQQSFGSPQQAADALIKAAEDYNVPALMSIFGPDAKDIVSSADPVHDKSNIEAFAAKARLKNTVAIDPAKQTIALLSVGYDDWPLPVPIVKRNGKWLFATKAGRSEILRRRIGANELDAIQVCRGFVDAQREYASEIHDGSGLNQYAQKIISTPGKHDGLFWRNSDGTPGGPISETVARAIEEGYSVDKRSAFHGYYFKVLKGQGPAAPLGKIDYVIEGVMIGGFGLLAVPAEYGVTGIKSFIVSNDGIVYEKDLGPNSIEVGKKINLYNPDHWQPTDSRWPQADVNLAAD